MEESAAKTFDEMREGAQGVMVVALDRLRETQEALQAGDFERAYARCGEAQVKVGALVTAERSLAAFAGKTALRARDLQAGMDVIGEGIIQSVENVSEHSDDCAEAVFQFTLEGGEVRRAYSDQELLVARSAD